MSWLTDIVRKIATGETKGERNTRYAAEAQLRAMQAIGPSPSGDALEAGVMGGGETPEQRRRRLARLANLQRYGDAYGQLQLGNTSLLGQ